MSDSKKGEHTVEALTIDFFRPLNLSPLAVEQMFSSDQLGTPDLGDPPKPPPPTSQSGTLKKPKKTPKK